MTEAGSRTSLAPAQAEQDDRLLVRLAQKGDRRAFESLYRISVTRIYALCLRLTGDAAVAEECVQEAYISAWQNLDKFRGDSAFGSWMYRIATNQVMSHFRKQGRLEQHVRPVEEGEWERIDAPPEHTGLGMDLEGAIATLPDGARTVFVLHDVEGHRHEEIAAMTGMAVGTSKAQLHRARRLLRERLDA